MLGAGVYSAAESLPKATMGDTGYKEAANDILNNMALAGGLGIAGEGAAVATKGAMKGAKRLMASIRDIRPESIALYAENPKAVNEAIKTQMQGEFLPKFAEDVQGKISEFVSNRTNQLDEILNGVERPVSIKPLLDAANNELTSLSGVVATPLRKSQVGLLKKQIEMLQKMGNEVPASQVQEIKKQLQEQLSSFFESAPKKIKQNSLDKALANIEEAAVKTVEGINPAIDTINAELKRGIELQKNLKLGNVLNGGFDTEKARRLLGTLSNDSKSEIRKFASELDNLTGTQFVSSSEVFRAAQDLAVKDVMSTIKTGRSVLPILLGGAAGGFAGDNPKSSSTYGLLGMLAASPLTTKPIISIGSTVNALAQNPEVRSAVGRGLFGRLKEKEGGQ